MLKKDVLGSASAKSLDEAYKCRECLHFQRHSHPSHKTICKDEGVKPYALAPKCFTPDVTRVANNPDTFVALSSILSTYNADEKRILLALLRSPKKGKDKLSFGTKVYFLAFGKDYLSNYLSGYFVGYSSTNEIMIAGSPQQRAKGGKSYMFFCKDTENLLFAPEWKVKRRELLDKGRTQDPSNPLAIKNSTVNDYEPPSLDTAPAAWLDKQEAKPKRKRNAELNFKVS